MADENRIVYPDDAECMKAAGEAPAVPTNSGEEPPKTVDNDRIVYPDEFDCMKAAGEQQAVDSNSIEEPLEYNVQVKNMIQVPPNCPAGQARGADGVCRDVF